MKILVTGGTGTLGRLVVPRLRDAGQSVRVLSRQSHAGAEGIESVTGDLATGEGLGSAVSGAEIIVHLAGTRNGDEDKARHLVAAATRTGMPHLVYISVVGAERVPVSSPLDRAMFGYFESKLAAERVVANSGLPWTTLRAAQFHESLLKLVQQMAKLPGYRFRLGGSSSLSTLLRWRPDLSSLPLVCRPGWFRRLLGRTFTRWPS
ncbi:MAG TPA: NAD(P)-binding oxidoreductase [Propionibacteriaceae bacterium]